MATLIFDIETVGERWDELDATTQESLTRWVDRTHTGEEREALRTDIRESLGFSPFTGSIVAIGLYDLERGEGVVYYVSESADEESTHNAFTCKARSEDDMLAAFWDGAREYDTFVSYNGRRFDVPFLNIRSAVHGIAPSRDLMGSRYLRAGETLRHIDLQDQLAYYGAAARRPSLHVACRAFGIKSPKAEGVGGDDVAELFRLKKFRDIAEYNAGDVIATTELYKKWRDYLAPAHIRAEL